MLNKRELKNCPGKKRQSVIRLLLNCHTYYCCATFRKSLIGQLFPAKRKTCIVILVLCCLDLLAAWTINLHCRSSVVLRVMLDHKCNVTSAKLRSGPVGRGPGGHLVCAYNLEEGLLLDCGETSSIVVITTYA